VLVLGAVVCALGWLVVRRPMVALVARLERTPLGPILTARTT